MQPYWIPLFILGSATPWFKSIPRVQTIVLVLLGISCLVSVRDGLDPRHRHNVKAILSGITAVFVFVWAAGLESGLIRVVPQGDTLRAYAHPAIFAPLRHSQSAARSFFPSRLITKTTFEQASSCTADVLLSLAENQIPPCQAPQASPITARRGNRHVRVCLIGPITSSLPFSTHIARYSTLPENEGCCSAIDVRHDIYPRHRPSRSCCRKSPYGKLREGGIQGSDGHIGGVDVGTKNFCRNSTGRERLGNLF